MITQLRPKYRGDLNKSNELENFKTNIRREIILIVCYNKLPRRIKRKYNTRSFLNNLEKIGTLIVPMDRIYGPISINITT